MMMDSDDEAPGKVTAPRRRKRINKHNKVHIVFNEEARREFLTGFRKRKMQRKAQAQEEFKAALKAEKKRIKLESKEQHKKLVRSYKPIPELEEQLAEKYEVEDATVSVLELDTDLLTETNFIIGRNKTQYEDVKKESDIESEADEELPGMELKAKPPKLETKSTKPKPEQEFEPKTRKDVKKAIKQSATKIVKKSKVFKKLNELHKRKQKKKSMRSKKENMKVLAKSKKGRHKSVRRDKQ